MNDQNIQALVLNVQVNGEPMPLEVHAIDTSTFHETPCLVSTFSGKDLYRALLDRQAMSGLSRSLYYLTKA